MKNVSISNHSELEYYIFQLKTEKYNQEVELKNELKEFVKTLDPLSIVKKSLKNFVEDNEVKIDLAKTGLNIGANFLIAQVLGKSNSIKGFFSSILAQQVSTVLINNNYSGIISGISKMFNNNSQPKSNKL